MKKNTTISNMDTINVMSMTTFMFMLTKMSFSEIAEAYFDAEAEWAMMWFTGLEDETSAPWKSRAIKEYLMTKCDPFYRDVMEDSLSELSALASDAGEQVHVGACLFNEDDKQEVDRLIKFIGGLKNKEAFNELWSRKPLEEMSLEELGALVPKCEIPPSIPVKDEDIPF